MVPRKEHHARGKDQEVGVTRCCEGNIARMRLLMVPSGGGQGSSMAFGDLPETLSAEVGGALGERVGPQRAGGRRVQRQSTLEIMENVSRRHQKADRHLSPGPQKEELSCLRW